MQASVDIVRNSTKLTSKGHRTIRTRNRFHDQQFPSARRPHHAFGVFVLLALLLYYRDWAPIIVAASVIAAPHLVFFMLQQRGTSIFLVEADAGWPIVLIHAGYVMVETLIRLILARHAAREALVGEQRQ